MKISKKYLRRLINESINESNLPPGTRQSDIDDYYYGGDDDVRQTGLSIEMAFYDPSHPLFRGSPTGMYGDIEFSDYGADSAHELSEEQYRKIEADVMAIVNHPSSRLEANEVYEASQEFIDAMQGNSSNTGTYFYPVFGEDNSYDGPDDFDYDPYETAGNFGPDMFSR